MYSVPKCFFNAVKRKDDNTAVNMLFSQLFKTCLKPQFQNERIFIKNVNLLKYYHIFVLLSTEFRSKRSLQMADLWFYLHFNFCPTLTKINYTFNINNTNIHVWRCLFWVVIE